MGTNHQIKVGEVLHMNTPQGLRPGHLPVVRFIGAILVGQGHPVATGDSKGYVVAVETRCVNQYVYVVTVATGHLDPGFRDTDHTLGVVNQPHIRFVKRGVVVVDKEHALAEKRVVGGQ